MRLRLLLLRAMVPLLAFAVSAGSCGVCLQKRGAVSGTSDALQRRNAVLFAAEDSLKTFLRPGDSTVVSYSGFFSPYYICGSRGKYLRLYSYSQDNLSKRQMKDKKQIRGWIKKSDMIDIESASLIKKRYVLAVNDYSLLDDPDRFFVNEDSVWLYSSGSLKRRNGKIPLYKPVFLIKHSEADSSSLVAESPFVPFPYSDLSCSGRWLSRVKIGWVSDKLLSPEVTDSTKLVELRDSSNIKIPWNSNSFLTLKGADSVICRELNIIIVFPPDKCRYDNRAQMTKLFNESRSAICNGVRGNFGNYKVCYMAALSDGGNGMLSVIAKSKDSTSFFDSVAASLSKNVVTENNATYKKAGRGRGSSVYKILSGVKVGFLDTARANSLNFVIIIGSSAGSDNGYVLEELIILPGISLLSCQIDENSSPDNKAFVIQSAGFIRRYAAESTRTALENRLFYIVPGGDSLLHRQSRMREFEEDIYLLDFPNNSCAVGGVVYPGLHKTLSGGKLYRGIEIILWQLGRRQRLMERVLERGFKMPELQRGERMRDSTVLPDAARAFFGKSQLYAYF